jgi:hypothetical protein
MEEAGSGLPGGCLGARQSALLAASLSLAQEGR